MTPNEDILDMVEREQMRAQQRSLRALIIQPGALGDCLLTLPLARILQQSLGLGGIDILGHMDSLSILPERSDIHSVRSLDSLALHRLFQPPDQFQVADRDPLIYAFSEYTWIFSFMGESGSDFEQNLIYTVHCSHGAEIVTLPLKPPSDYTDHVTDFYVDQLIGQLPTLEAFPPIPLDQPTLSPIPEDYTKGKQILQHLGVTGKSPVVLIHPGSGGTSKCWHLDNFLAIAQQLEQQNVSVAFLVGPVEQERWSPATMARLQDTAPLLQNLSVEQSLAVLTQAQIAIVNDSGISHLAAGLGIPTCVLFGPTDPAQYRPPGPKVQILQHTGPDFSQKPSPALQQQLLASIKPLLQPLD